MAKKKERFALIPAAMLRDERVKQVGLRLYAELALLVDDGARSWPSQKHLARLLGWSEAQVCRGLQQLEATGWINRVDGTFVIETAAP